MNLNHAKIEITAVRPEQYPAGDTPEIAFVGRSNVGKSSILNALLNRKNLARIGATPGKTREINFYNIDDQLYFVDLPGYGYASVSKTQKSAWGEIIETYLYSRRQLKLIVMLVDIRHAPSGDDRTMYDWLLGHGMPHLVVATKADKISRGQWNGRLQDIKAVLGIKEDIPLIPFSAETKAGREEIWEQINGMLQ